MNFFFSPNFILWTVFGTKSSYYELLVGKKALKTSYYELILEQKVHTMIFILHTMNFYMFQFFILWTTWLPSPPIAQVHNSWFCRVYRAGEDDGQSTDNVPSIIMTYLIQVEQAMHAVRTSNLWNHSTYLWCCPSNLSGRTKPTCGIA